MQLPQRTFSLVVTTKLNVTSTHGDDRLAYKANTIGGR